MKKTDLLRLSEYLAHMSEAIDRIQRYVDDLAEPAFLADSKTQDAVVRNFEILGEAARNIERHHPDFAAAHPEVPWSVIYTMRNRLAHGSSKSTTNCCGRPSTPSCRNFNTAFPG